MPSLAAIVRFPLRAVPKSATVRVLAGPAKGARWVAGASSHGCWLGTYERETQAAVAAHLRPGAVLYDVGANVGFYTVLGMQRGALVHAYEPEMANVAALRRHIAMNVGRAFVHMAAVSDREGWATFGGAGATGHLTTEGGALVRTTTLDAERAQGRVKPDVLKIDVEGAELAVLRGAAGVLARDRPVIVLGVHGKVIDGENVDRECFALLDAAGYALRQITSDGYLCTPHAAVTPC